MPRIFRTLVAHGYYHVINRGNNRSDVFLSPSDYRAFLRLIEQAQQRIPLRMLAFCIMPNHFHLVVSQDGAKDVSRWMHWLLTTHVHRHHLKYGTSGRLWQGRFKAFPIEQDGHLLTVMRYVERNALRSGIVARAEQWPWGSLACRGHPLDGGLVSKPPMPLPSDWTARVNAPQTPQELEALRAAVNRQRPYAELATA